MGYPNRMTQRRDSQKRAEQAYDAKRPKKPVSFRLDDDEMATLDEARGEKSRSEFALQATLKAAMRTAKKE